MKAKNKNQGLQSKIFSSKVDQKSFNLYLKQLYSVEGYNLQQHSIQASKVYYSGSHGW